MEMDKKGMMNEVGGAFVVSWLVFSGMGQGMGTGMAQDMGQSLGQGMGQRMGQGVNGFR